jgi:glycine dehydrogenase subunit 1
MAYTPNPPRVVQEMLEAMGLGDIDQLFIDIPGELQLDRELDLGESLSELELRKKMSELAGRNMTTGEYPCFLGAGAYDHYVPAVVEHVLSRSEFVTAYTPYQAELSQGVLQSIFEYQSMICTLTGMDVCNASMFDGGSSVAEACSLAVDATRRKKVVIASTINPRYLEVVKTYTHGKGIEVVVIPGCDGAVDADEMVKQIDKETAAAVLQYPNFNGLLEPDMERIETAVHGVKGLLIMAVDPISLGILKPPADWGADIAVGEGQALGNPLSFGGPYLGFFAANKKLMRRVPGRLVGQTKDLEGKRAFVLTLQAREQHIRREKASSNICSNEALCALAATVYLSIVGPGGLRAIATRCHELACYARDRLQEAGFPLKYQLPFFKEFPVQLADPAAANMALLKQGIIGGYELDDALLFAFTEKRTKKEIDKMVDLLKGVPA